MVTTSQPFKPDGPVIVLTTFALKCPNIGSEALFLIVAIPERRVKEEEGPSRWPRRVQVQARPCLNFEHITSLPIGTFKHGRDCHCTAFIAHPNGCRRRAAQICDPRDHANPAPLPVLPAVRGHSALARRYVFARRGLLS